MLRIEEPSEQNEELIRKMEIKSSLPGEVFLSLNPDRCFKDI